MNRRNEEPTMCNNNLIEDFKQLRVYQAAFKAAMQIFERSKQWPKEERYALIDQIRRSSRSVCANIAEAWFKRRYPKHFVSKLSDASTEAGEKLIWLDFAESCGYLPQGEAENMSNTYRAIIGGLTKMIDRPDQWCVSSTTCEPTIEYETDS